jgi:hypothetical protein
MIKHTYKNKVSPKLRALIIIFVLIFIGLSIGLLLSNSSISNAQYVIRELNISLDPVQESTFSNLYTISLSVLYIDILLLLGLL